jgi:hypothetical protein
MKRLTAQDFVHLDVPTEVEKHTSTRLSYGRTQYSGACPYDDCPGDDDGFMVWSELTARNCHFHCRTCRRSGDIVKLIQDIKGIPFGEACAVLEIGQGKPALDKNMARAERERKRKEASEQERAILARITQTSARGLQYERVQVYLEQRCIPLAVAQQYGLCYIPPLKSMSEDLQQAWWPMRQWTDRLLFPLSEGGFTGRTLFLWTPGIDENEHKKSLDAFNGKVNAYNQRMNKIYGKDAYKHRKDKIPRYYTTIVQGYFHGEVLQSCEHVTIVEGPFDALAALAGGVSDVIAAGRNGIRSEDIPVHVCYATIAFDGDTKGQEAADLCTKIFRRKGIKTQRCTPPDDEKGKDWSERFRLHGPDGVVALLDRSFINEEYCTDCHTSITAVDREFFYIPVSEDKALCYCSVCREKIERNNHHALMAV